jgi:hypothetical protein
MVPLLEPLIRLAGRVTDPLLEPIERAQLVRSSSGSPRVRSVTVAVNGAVLLALFAAHFSGPLLDEMPLGTLTLWALLVVGAVYLAGPQPSRRRLGLSPQQH